MTDEKSTDTAAEATTVDADKQDLDTILESWNDKGETKEAKTDNPLAARLEAVEGELTQRIIDDEIVPIIKGDVEVPNKVVRGYLAESAAENPKLNELFQNRNANKAQFKKALEAVAADFQKEMGGTVKAKEKQSPNDDLAAAVASARETKSTGTDFDSINWSELSPAEFEMKKQAVFKAVGAGQLK